jgi:hypothetical protein
VQKWRGVYCEKPYAINLPYGDGIYRPFVVMAYNWVYHIAPLAGAYENPRLSSEFSK